MPTEKIEVVTEEKLDSASLDIESAEHRQVEKQHVKSPAEKRLFRKINIATMPLVCLVVFVQFIDKSTINTAAVMGLYEDTHITQNQFSWLGSIFYVGYLAFQIPNNYLLQRLPISKYLGLILVIWGVVLGCLALSRNFSDLAGIRFLLGFLEASTYPCIFLLISILYRRSEQVVFFTVMFVCNGVATAAGGLIGYGIGNMHGLRGISAWKWCMIIWGIVTVVLGILLFLWLPDKAKSRWFRLTPEEDLIVEERIKDNAVVANKVFKVAHIKEALKESRFYCICLISLFVNLQNGCLTIFSSQIIKDMGFTNLQSILLGIPYGASVIICLTFAMYLSRRFNSVCFVGAISMFIAMVGAIVLVAIPSGPVKLLGIYIGATSPPYVMLQTCISNNVSGYTKKIFYTSGNLVFYCIGNFVGPLMMVENEAPRYIGGMSGYVVADFLTILIFVYMRYSFVRDNRRRELLRKEQNTPPPPENRDELDLTDKEDLWFRYRP